MAISNWLLSYNKEDLEVKDPGHTFQNPLLVISQGGIYNKEGTYG